MATNDESETHPGRCISVKMSVPQTESTYMVVHFRKSNRHVGIAQTETVLITSYDMATHDEARDELAKQCARLGIALSHLQPQDSI